jgi:hypothetical protein
MSQYFYSPAQAAIINSSLTLANIGCDDKLTALHTLAIRIMHQLWKGEGTLVVMPSAADREDLQGILNNMGLGDITLDLCTGMPVTAEDGRDMAERIMRLKKHNQAVDLLPAHTYNAHVDGILSTFEARFSQSNHELSWRQMLDYYLTSAPDDRVEKLVGDLGGIAFECTSAERSELRSFIADALHLYRRDFELYRSFTLLPSGIRHDEALNNRLEEISHALFVLREAAESLRDRYTSHMRWLRFSYMDEITGRTMSLENRLRLLHADLLDHLSGQKQGEQRSTMAVSRLMHEFHNLFSELSTLDIVSRQHFREVTRDMLLPVEGALIAITERYQQIPTQVSVRLKSVNRHNTQDPVLEDLESDLQALVQRINDTQLFEKAFEVNTQSFKKQTDVVISIVKKLENAHLELQKELPYYHWLEFLQASEPKAVAVLTSLLSFDPSEWSALFESWYACEWLARNIDIRHSGLSSSASMQMYASLYNDFCQCNCNQAVARAGSNIEIFMKSVKKDAPDVHEVIFRNSKLSRPVRWKSWIESCGASMADVFPVLLIDNDADLQWPGPSAYRHLVFYRHHDPNVELMQLFSTVYSWFSANETGIDFYLSHQFNYTVVSSGEVRGSQKLALARTQAEALFALGRQPEIFGMKQGSIISFASGFINEWLEEHLYDAGIKRLTDTEEGMHMLTAALLERSDNIFLITEDNVINPEDTNTLVWQHHLLDCIKSAGCVHVNIDTALLYRTNGSSLRSVINHIKRHHTFSAKETTKQLRFAFD